MWWLIGEMRWLIGEMRWLIGRAPDRSPGFESGISHNDTDALQIIVIM